MSGEIRTHAQYLSSTSHGKIAAIASGTLSLPLCRVQVSEQTPTATSTPPTAFSANGVQDPGQCWIPIPPLIEDTFGKSGDSETRQKIRGLQPAVPKPGTKSSSLHHPVATATRDVETGAVVYSSPGGKGAVVVLYRDGVTVTSHADGTVQRWRSGKGEAGSTGGGLVLVECPGFVSVEVSVTFGAA